MPRPLSLHLMVVCAAALIAVDAGAQTPPLAQGGRSAWVIYREVDAPESVLLAATELQRVLRLSTGTELPIVDAPASPMICRAIPSTSRQILPGAKASWQVI